MVLAVEQPVEDLAQGADMMQVVQDDDQRHVHSVVLAGALVGEVGEVLAQFLRRPGRNEWVNAPGKTHVLGAFPCPGPALAEGPFLRPHGNRC